MQSESRSASEFEFVAFNPDDSARESKEKKRLVKSKAMRNRHLNRKAKKDSDANNRKVVPLLPKGYGDGASSSWSPSALSSSRYSGVSAGGGASSADEESYEAAGDSQEFDYDVARGMLTTPSSGFHGERMDSYEAVPDARTGHAIPYGGGSGGGGPGPSASSSSYYYYASQHPHSQAEGEQDLSWLAGATTSAELWNQAYATSGSAHGCSCVGTHECGYGQEGAFDHGYGYDHHGSAGLGDDSWHGGI